MATLMPGAPPERRSLLPREHGVYAELLFPLVTAMSLATPSLSGVLLAVAIITAVLAHEPLLVLLGRRGVGRRDRLGARARTRLLVLATLGVVSATIAVLRSDVPVRIALLCLIPLGATQLMLVMLKRERTLIGEALTAVTLAAASVPVGLACGVALPAALAAAVVWALSFLFGTLTVHAVFARQKQQGKPVASLVMTAVVLTLAGAGGAAAAGRAWAWAVFPAALVSCVVLVRGLSPQRLRVLGWSLVLGNILAMIVLIGALR